jgi:hypothetical protein
MGLLLRTPGVIVRRPGATSALALAASGLEIALDPRRAGTVMRLRPEFMRGNTELRLGAEAGLGLAGVLSGRRR